MNTLSLPAIIAAVAAALGATAAHADIYTWTDKSGLVNVSNLPPPEGARISKVVKETPKDPAREAAARESARQAEVRALNERVQQLQDQVEQARRDVPPPVAMIAPPMMPAYDNFAPPAPYIVNVVQAPAPAYPAGGGCAYSWGDCGFGLSGFYAPSVVVVRGRNPRHGGGSPQYGTGQIVPPLMPTPPQFRPMSTSRRR